MDNKAGISRKKQGEVGWRKKQVIPLTNLYISKTTKGAAKPELCRSSFVAFNTGIPIVHCLWMFFILSVWIVQTGTYLIGFLISDVQKDFHKKTANVSIRRSFADPILIRYSATALFRVFSPSFATYICVDAANNSNRAWAIHRSMI